jgi:4-amino-4-deoxy-L-arabinose transferase-like glycosyltransferase
MEAQELLIGAASALLLAICGLAALYLTANHRDTFPFQQGLFIAALAVRFAAATTLAIPNVYQAIVGSADASGWQNARVFKETIDQSELGALAIPQEVTASFDGINRGYPALLGIYFYATRLDSEHSAAALSCAAGAMTAVMAYRMARLLFGEWVAVRVGWLVCFFPSMIVWSIQTIKEPFVILFELVAMYACTVLRDQRLSLRHVGLWLACILALIPLRFYAAYVLGGVILISLLVPNLGRGSVSFGSALIGGLILFAIFSAASDQVRTHQETLESFDLDRVQDFRQAVATGDGSGSGVQTSTDLKSNGGLSLAVISGAFHLLLAPFPWQFAGGSLRFILTAPEMLVWWSMVLGGLIRGLARTIRRQPSDALPMLLFMIALGSVYSLMFGNIGIVYRQRAQLLPYLFMLSMVGFEASRARRHRISSDDQNLASLAPLARISSAMETVS